MNFHSSVEAFISYRNSVAWETQNDVVVYVDDFIGSGGSVVTALSSLDKKDVSPEVLSDAYSGRLYVGKRLRVYTIVVFSFIRTFAP